MQSCGCWGGLHPKQGVKKAHNQLTKGLKSTNLLFDMNTSLLQFVCALMWLEISAALCAVTHVWKNSNDTAVCLSLCLCFRIITSATCTHFIPRKKKKNPNSFCTQSVHQELIAQPHRSPLAPDGNTQANGQA